MTHGSRERGHAHATSLVAFAFAALVAGCGGAAAPGSPARATAQGVTPALNGTAYYIDDQSGNDSRPGTSMPLAWRSFAPLSKLAVPAGAIYLRCGGTWRQTLTLGPSALAAGGIVAPTPTTCGGQPTRITGANDFSTSAGGHWTKDPATGIWSSPVPAGTPPIPRLYVDGVPYRVAQWPDTAPTLPERPIPLNTYNLIDAGQAASTSALKVKSADAGVLAGKDLSTAVLHVRDYPWFIEDRPVRSYANGVITLQAPTTYAMQAGQGYVLSNALWMLSAPGEFFHDTRANKLYLLPASPTMDVTQALVEGAVRANAIALSRLVSATVTGLQADMTTLDAVSVQADSGSTLTQLTAQHGGSAGIHIYGGSAGVTVSNSQVSDNPLYGINDIAGTSDTISGNTVSATGLFGYTGPIQAAIGSGPGATVQGNQVQQSGYQGITFSPLAGTKVSGNTVAGYCIVLSDCAAIYAYGSATQAPPNQSSTVSGNTIGGAIANTAGTGATIGSPTLVAGIYLDDLTVGSTVSGNLVAGAPTGVMIHNGSSHTVTGNTLWLDTDASVSMVMDKGASAMHGDVVSANLMAPAQIATGTYPALPKLTTALAINYVTQAADASEITQGTNTFQGNRIERLQAGSLAAARVHTSAGDTTYTSAGWRTLAPADTIVAAPLTFDAYRLTTQAQYALQPDGDFSSPGWTPWWSTGVAGTFALASDLGTGCLSTCAQFGTVDPHDVLHAPATLPLVAGQLYALSYDATFTDPGLVLPATFMQLSNADASVSAPVVFTNADFAGAQDSVHVEGWAQPTLNAPAYASLKLGTPGVVARLSNVSVLRITGYSVASPNDWALIVEDSSAIDYTLSCSDVGWADAAGHCAVVDIDGNPVAMPVVVPKGQSRLFLHRDSAWVHAGP